MPAMRWDEIERTNNAYAAQIRQIYADAEEIMLKKVRKRLEKGINEPGWAEKKLAEIRLLNNDINAEIADLRKADKGIDEAVTKAYDSGAKVAADDLIKANLTDSTAVTWTRGNSLRALVKETVQAVDSTHFRILRTAQDAYRQSVAAATSQTLTGAKTVREVVQDVLNDFADRGISGYVDAAGKHWTGQSYAEMAVRTATQHASRQGHTDKLEKSGYDLVITSSHTPTCELCWPWQNKVLSLNGQTKGYPTLADAQAAGFYHPNCVTGDTIVSGPRVKMTFTRRYDGNIIIINTTGGKKLTVTPNHPILTPKGWIEAGLLNKGDNVLCYISGERSVSCIDPDNELIPASISDVVKTFIQSGDVVSATVPTTTKDFHGDGGDSQVCVIRANRLLLNNVKSIHAKPIRKNTFGFADMCKRFLFAQGTFSKIFRSACHTTNNIVCRFRDFLTFIRRHFRIHSIVGFATGNGFSFERNPSTYGGMVDTEGVTNSGLGFSSAVTGNNLGNISRFNLVGNAKLFNRDKVSLDSSGFNNAVDIRGTNAHILGNDVGRLSGKITVDTILSVEIQDFSGHVYNLQTVNGWYACNSIITHNCGHTQTLYTPGLTEEPEEPTTEQLQANKEEYAALQKQRKLERGLRQWKRREAVAITPEAEQKAKAKVKEWRDALKDHVDTTNADYRAKYGKDLYGNDRQLTYRQSWREADKVTSQAERDAAATKRSDVINARIAETKRIQADIKAGNYKLNVKTQQQEQHIPETKAFIREQSKGSNKSYFEGYTTSDVQDVVNKKAGKGYSAVMTPGSKYPSEYVKMSEAVGKTWDDKQGKYIDTDVFEIRYSSKGVHAFPVSPKKGKTK